MPDRRPLVVIADGPVSVVSPPASLAKLLKGREPDLLAGWSPGRPPWLDAYLAAEPREDGPWLRTVMGGYGLTRALAEGRAGYVPVRLSAVPRLLRQLRPALAVIPAVPRGSGFALRGSVGWQLAAARWAEEIVLEVDPSAEDLGLPLVPGRVVEVREASSIAHTYEVPTPRLAERVIGALVAELLPEGATIQFGPGGIGAAVVDAIDKPVRIASGLVSASLRGLEERGLLRGTATASYDWGGEATLPLLRDGRLSMLPIDETNDPGRIAGIDHFVAVNTALQVGLDGSVNVERLGGRVVAGIGGHADFCCGACRSRGGLSIIAVQSTARGCSTIVPVVETVSTGRTDVDVVVTEHGVADLRGCDDAQRRLRLIEVAAPEHRAELRAASEEVAISP